MVPDRTFLKAIGSFLRITLSLFRKCLLFGTLNYQRCKRCRCFKVTFFCFFSSRVVCVTGRQFFFKSVTVASHQGTPYPLPAR
uniref:Uncharacterized protein n=1 Tax=Anguilla anguilla TaxID=7936 RepID=A0A0E9WPW0_ANGAN